MTDTPERIVRHPREFSMTPDMVHPDEGHVHYIRADVAERWKRERDAYAAALDPAAEVLSNLALGRNVPTDTAIEGARLAIKSAWATE